MRRLPWIATALCVAVEATAAPCPTRPMWPTREWPSRVEEARANRAAQIAALEQWAFTLEGADEERRGPRTDGVVIIHQGAVFYERYARNWTAEMPHYAWSMSKTVTNAMTAIAVREGLLSLDTSICDVLRASLPRREYCAIRVQNLLEFSSGINWVEEYENAENQASSVLAMLYGVGSNDMVRFIASHDLRDTPGTTYMYSSGDSTLLAGVVERVLRVRFGAESHWPLLFDPLGMRSAVFERDAQGTPVGSSYWHATPRDMARFGFFLLNDGCWEGQRMLPENWVQDSVQPSAPFRMRRIDAAEGDVQGRQLWLNRSVPELGIARPWPDVPEDAFAARGHWGQSITVIPSLDLVIVRVADDRQRREGFFNGFLARAIAVVR